ncbi:MAG TPA: PAS domain S-box protein, partial [bacterium]
ALMTVDPNGVIADVNEQTAKLTGFNRKQLIGSPFAQYFTDPERARAGIRTTFDEGVVTNYELVVRSKAGRKVAVSFNAAVFADATGAVQGILAAARDITQQKQIEQELREQQTYTRGLVESGIDALMTTDLLGLITDVNRRMCEITGRAREELIGTPFKDYFTDPQRAEDGIRRVLAEDQVTNYELTIRAKDGEETVVSYNATTFKGADGRLRGVFAAARDITEQKRLEEQITQQYQERSETTAFLNNILESSTEYSIIAMDREGNVLAWNEGARRNYGYAAEEMIGKQNSRILHTKEDVESGKVEAALAQALETGKFEGEFQRMRKSGEQFTAQVAITLRRGVSGDPVGYLLVSKDITAQKALEEELRRKNEELVEQYHRVQEANRLKSEFLANMSHELRTPLNGIIGFAELMHGGKVGPVADPHKEYLGDILTSSRHLLQLINDVLDLARVEAGRMEFHPEAVDLAKLVGEVRDGLRTMAATKRIQVKTQIDPGLNGVTADPAKLKQLLYNYLSNALKFTPDGGQVTVRVGPEEADTYRIEVEDTGIGIRPEDLGRLFVEFQQLDAGAAKKYQGTGLGLALTKRIVEAQGGQVGVRSAPGTGSIFFAVLPRVFWAERESPARSAARPDGRAAASPVANGPAVLIIDDDQRERAWLMKTLGKAGYAVEAAATGAEAVARCREKTFSAITLDLLLPDMKGWDVLKAIRAEERNKNVAVIVVTMVADQGVLADQRADGALVKPVRSEELLAALQRIGVRPDGDGDGAVLVVDDDLGALKIMEAALAEIGYRPVCMPDGESGLAAAAKERLRAVVLDLRMPGMNGLEFLDRFRRTDNGSRTPVIVWTGADLTAQDKSRLKAAAQAIVVKGRDGVKPLLKELQACLAVSR